MKRASSRTVITSEAVAPKFVNNIAPDAIRAQVGRMLRSKTFSTSPRLSRFLEFSVEQTLLGRQNSLKEYIIGVEVFERTESFDPRVDAIVRVEARRLRAKIELYYTGEGCDDNIVIYYERGSYSPRIMERTEAEHTFRSLVPSCMQRPTSHEELRQFHAANNQEKLEKWLRFVLHATQAALWNLDMGTGAMIWSAEAHQLFGGRMPANTLANFIETIHAQDGDALKDSVGQASREGRDFELRVRLRLPEFDGREMVIRGASGGVPQQLIGILRLDDAD